MHRASSHVQPSSARRCTCYSQVLFLALAVPSWILLRYSVSAESLWDILGAPILHWPGDWELFLRYLAFCTPLLWIYLWDLWFEGAARLNAAFGTGQFLAGLLLALPVFLLGKWGVIDAAATDNIRELVADSGSVFALVSLWLLPGGVALHGVMIARAVQQGRRNVVVVVLTTPLLWLASWWLLRQALTPEAISFLLSAGRDRYASEHELLLRWTAAYAAGVSVITVAHWLLPRVPARRFPLPAYAGGRPRGLVSSRRLAAGPGAGRRDHG